MLPSRSCLLDKHCTKPANPRATDTRFRILYLAEFQKNSTAEAKNSILLLLTLLHSRSRLFTLKCYGGIHHYEATQSVLRGNAERTVRRFVLFAGAQPKAKIPAICSFESFWY